MDPALIEQVRLLIADTAPAPKHLFTNDQLATYLTLTGGNPRLAAADALEAIAVSEVLISKKIRTQDLSTDGPAVAEALRKLAVQQRQIAADEDGAEIFDVVDTIADCRRPEHTNHEVWGL